MNTSTVEILDHAEARSKDLQQAAQIQDQTFVKAMREEIGTHHYTEAKKQLSIMDQAITQHSRPFLQRMATLVAQAPTTPDSIRRALAEMNMCCETAVQQVQSGIQGYDGLSLKAMLRPDGRSVDGGLRAERIAQIRQALRSHDGKVGFLSNQQAIIARYIEDSGWPAAPTVRD